MGCYGMKAIFQVAVFIALSGIASSANAGNIKILPLASSNSVIKIQSNEEFKVSDIRAFSSTQIPVEVRLPDYAVSGGKKMWLRVIGLPSGLQFSLGANVNGVWFIPIQNIERLYLKLPNKYTGKFNLDFFLMRNDSPVVSIVGKHLMNVTILDKVIVQKPKPNSKSESKPKPKTTSLPNTKAPVISEEEETILLQRAEELMRLGTFHPARLIYEELAKQGSVKGALELARTYDPNIIRQNPISGMKPDPEKARSWYNKARQLGGE